MPPLRLRQVLELSADGADRAMREIPTSLSGKSGLAKCLGDDISGPYGLSGAGSGGGGSS